MDKKMEGDKLIDPDPVSRWGQPSGLPALLAIYYIYICCIKIYERYLVKISLELCLGATAGVPKKRQSATSHSLLLLEH